MRPLVLVGLTTLALLAACNSPKPTPVASKPRPRPRAPVASASASAEPPAEVVPQPDLDPLAPLPEGAIARCGTTRMRFLRRPKSLAITNTGVVISVEEVSGSGHVIRDLNRAATLGKIPQGGEAALSPQGTLVALVEHRASGEIGFYRTEGGSRLGSVTVALPKKQRFSRGRVWDSQAHIRDLLFSFNGARLAVVLSEGPDYLIDTDTRTVVRTLTQKGRLVGLDSQGKIGLFVERSEELFALHTDIQGVSVVNLEQGRVLRRLEFKATPPPKSDPQAATVRAPLSQATFALSADGSQIFATESDELLSIDVATGNRAKIAEHVSRGAFDFGWSFGGSPPLLVSPDGTHVAWTHSGNHVVTDLSGGAERLAPEESLQAFSPDGRLLLAASDHVAIVQGVEVSVPEGHEAPIRDLGFLSGGKVLASAGGDLRFWDGRSCQLLRTSSSQGKVGGLTVSNQGNKLLVHGQKLREVGVEGSVATLDFKHGLEAYALSPEGTVTLIATHGYEDGGGLTLFRQGASVLSTKVQGEAKAVSFSPSGTLVAVLLSRPWGPSSDAVGPSLTVRNAETLEITNTLPRELAEGASTVVFVGDDDRLLLGSAHRGMTLVDRKQGNVIRRFGWASCCDKVAVSRDGTLVAGSSDSTIGLWEVATRKFKGVWTGHGGDVTSLAFSPSGKVVASGSEDTTILLWDINKTHASTKDQTVLQIADAKGARATLREYYVSSAGKILARDPSSKSKAPDLKGVVRLTEGGLFHCALLDSGKVSCWGWTRSGALGIPEQKVNKRIVNQEKPVEVPGVTDAVAIASARTHSCALTKSGALWCWGVLDPSQTNPDPVQAAQEIKPRAIAGLGAVVAFGVGEGHTCAVDTAGKVWCWGDGSHGELGDSTSKSSKVPIAVAGLSDATQVALGASHSCALRSNGSVVCWGINERDQLGEGTGVNSPTPVRVASVQDAVEIAAAGDLTCVRLRSQRVTCWGRSFDDKLSFPEPEDLPALAGSREIQVMTRRVCGEIGGVVKCY